MAVPAPLQLPRYAMQESGVSGAQIGQQLDTYWKKKSVDDFLEQAAQQPDVSYEGFVKSAAKAGIIDDPRVQTYAALKKDLSTKKKREEFIRLARGDNLNVIQQPTAGTEGQPPKKKGMSYEAANELLTANYPDLINDPAVKETLTALEKKQKEEGRQEVIGDVREMAKTYQEKEMGAGRTPYRHGFIQEANVSPTATKTGYEEARKMYEPGFITREEDVRAQQRAEMLRIQKQMRAQAQSEKEKDEIDKVTKLIIDGQEKAKSNVNTLQKTLEDKNKLMAEAERKMADPRSTLAMTKGKRGDDIYVKSWKSDADRDEARKLLNNLSNEVSRYQSDIADLQERIDKENERLIQFESAEDNVVESNGANLRTMTGILFETKKEAKGKEPSEIIAPPVSAPTAPPTAAPSPAPAPAQGGVPQTPIQVPQYGGTRPPAPQGGATVQPKAGARMTPEQQGAIEWLNNPANASDPRRQQIIQKLRTEGVL